MRSLYFVVGGLVGRFVHLKAGLAFVLAFAGLKLCLADVVHVPAIVSLAIIGVILATALALSLWTRGRAGREAPPSLLSSRDRDRAEMPRASSG